MKKTYADICLERAEKATEEPWLVKHHRSFGNLFRLDNPQTANQFVSQYEPNREFIAHSRTDVPELSRRLKKACEALREAEGRLHGYTDKTFGDLADELEAIPECEK
jgi:hypothetical protein